VYAVRAFVTIDTNLLWFRSVQNESVYTRMFWTQVVLFVIFSALMALSLTASLILLYRFRPDFRPDRAKQRWRFQFRRYERRLRIWLLVAVVGYLSISVGARAAGGWQTWLAWHDATSFHQKDPTFHRDVSYFVFDYPLHRLVLTLLFRIVATNLIVVLIAGYAYGAVKIRGDRPKLTKPVLAQISVILGIYLTLKVFAYWLDRLALVTSNRTVVTGPSYTDLHAVMPAKIVLMVIAGGCAIALFVNAYLRSGRVVIMSLSVMAAGAFLLGIALPAIVQQFWVKPSASTRELPSISRSIPMTTKAYGLNNTVTTKANYGATTLTGSALANQAKRNAQVRLLDPYRVSPTFNVNQQIEAFYQFKSTLDVDRYPINNRSTDVVLGARELNIAGLPASRKTWTNTHLVYTHGFGLVAAPTDKTTNGIPNFIGGGLPPTTHTPIKINQPRIYYGQMSPSYSIVGAPPGTPGKEFDLPSTNGSANSAGYTHTGGGGIPIGGFFHRLLYAIKLHSTSVLFSSEINSHSQLLTVRNPRTRINAVAPWLTLDGDTYPAVVNGRIVWVVDGYTTSNNYPDSQQVNLQAATSSTLSKSGSTVAQPSRSINYIRNSVKATVDAYSGKVTLYAWNQQAQPDPVLETWEKAFPGLIQPQSQMPAALVSHLRYPQDLFNVQRSILTRYHVTNASDFYNGNDFWKLPVDSSVGATSRLNAIGKVVTVSAPIQPSVYMSVSSDGMSEARYALSTPFVTLNRRNLSAFMSVDSEPGPDYGRLTLLEIPAGQSVKGPAQISNDIESLPRIANKLTLLRGGNSQVVIGNLLAMPLGGKFLYVEPVYTQAKTGTKFPVLRRVIAVYGNGLPAYRLTLAGAIAQALKMPTVSSHAPPAAATNALPSAGTSS